MAGTTLAHAIADYVHNVHKGSGGHRTLRNVAGVRAVVALPAQTPNSTSQDTTSQEVDPELRLPKCSSLFIMIFANALLQFSAYVTVSSASAYAAHLGGSAVFSGLTIGIPNVFSGLVLIPMTKIDQGRYTRPLQIACGSLILGNILHAVAYQANFLYLILMGRLVSGIGYTGFMYVRRYCSDPRIVGVRRHTTLASWLVIGQSFGLSAGPFLCGLLYKVGFSNEVFNGFTSPGWVTSSFWLLFTVAIAVVFQDLPKPRRAYGPNTIEMGNASAPAVTHAGLSPFPGETEAEPSESITLRQWGVIFSMCYSSMSCFFILGSWESNIPIFTAVAFGYSPYAAGNFIALGGIATLPFLLMSVRYSPRFQDRVTLSVGSAIGLAGLALTLVLLATDKLVFASLYACWFLVALGFNLASTCTLSLLSKQLPNEYNRRASLAIQYSNYLGRITGAVFGGAAVQIGMMNYIGVLIFVVGLGGFMHMVLWKELKAKTG